jgi:hypothetical protein
MYITGKTFFRMGIALSAERTCSLFMPILWVLLHCKQMNWCEVPFKTGLPCQMAMIEVQSVMNIFWCRVHPHHSLICSVWVIISLLLHYLHSIDINSGCMTSQNEHSIIHVAGINVPLSGWCKQQIFTKHVAWNKPGISIQLRFFAQCSRAIAIRIAVFK